MTFSSATRAATATEGRSLTAGSSRKAGRAVVEAAEAGDKLNVFISYSRDDLEFADPLDAFLSSAASRRPSTAGASRAVKTGRRVWSPYSRRRYRRLRFVAFIGAV